MESLSRGGRVLGFVSIAVGGFLGVVGAILVIPGILGLLSTPSLVVGSFFVLSGVVCICLGRSWFRISDVNSSFSDWFKIVDDSFDRLDRLFR